MDTWPDDLPAIAAHLWQRLAAACAASTPLRTPVLATEDDGQPAARVVVLRAADAATRTLATYSDVRAAKVGQLRRNPAAHWLFYDPHARVQIRATGRVVIHHGDELARCAWETLPLAQRANYAAPFSPGSEIARPTFALPMPANHDAGLGRFVVLCATLDRFDWLELGEPHHRRAAFAWDGHAWIGRWLVP